MQSTQKLAAAVLLTLLLGTSCQGPIPSNTSRDGVQQITPSGKPVEVASSIEQPGEGPIGTDTATWGVHMAIKPFVDRTPKGIANTFFHGVVDELRWSLPQFHRDHPSIPASIGVLLREHPLWFQQTFPNGTPCNVQEQGADKVEEPGVLYLRLTATGIEGTLLYPDENQARFEFSAEVNPSQRPEPKSTSALAATLRHYDLFTRAHGRFPESFEEMLSWRLIAPGPRLALITASQSNLPESGFLIQHPPQTQQTRTFDNSPGIPTRVRFSTYELLAASDRSTLQTEVELLETSDARVNSPGFGSFVAVKLLPSDSMQP